MNHSSGLAAERIAFTDDALTWTEAIRLVGAPLVADGTVEEAYLDGVIETAEKHGPYFDMGKGVALPHARPEFGANAIGLAFLRTRTPVLLMDDPKHPIDVFIMLSATDSSSHLRVLKALSGVLTNADSLERLKAATTPDEVLAVFPQITPQ